MALVQWLCMGGYALYVWPAYGLVVAVLLVYALSVVFQGARKRKALRRWLQRLSS